MSATSHAAIPQAVRRQAARAEQLAKEHREALAGVATPPAAPAPPGAASPPEVSPAPQTPPAAPATPPVADEATFQRKYQVLQGKYNSEIPRLQRMITELQEENRATRNLLASVTGDTRTRQPEPAAPAAPPAPVRLVTDQETQVFGADLIDVMRRVVREELPAVTTEVDRRLQPVNQRIDEVAATARTATRAVKKQSKEAVLAHMDERVPAWRTLNQDPEFLAWLEEVDPFSGKERGQLLVAAFEAFDSSRVEAFFVGYQKEHAAVTPPTPTPEPTPVPAAPAAPAPGTQVTLESMVAPGTPKPGAPRTPDGSDKKIWTRREIGEFYRSVNGGKFKGTVDQRKAIEADIFAAQAEGRIR